MKREIVIHKGNGESVSVSRIWDVIELWFTTIGNGDWVLKLERKVVQRTVSQNALMWVWFDVIAKEWSEATDKYYSRDCVKEFFCRKYLPLEMPDGSVVGGSTSALSTEQMSVFMEKVQAYAGSEWGISLLRPEDKMFNEWRDQYE